MTPKKFVAQLSKMHFKNVFNPYSDLCEKFDLEDAHIRRQKNLISILESAIDSTTSTIWIARDLGYRGGRRTGLALTDEANLEKFGTLFSGVEIEKATHGPMVKERTAGVIWKMLEEVNKPVLMWNVFPFHPHEPQNPLSNRCHTRYEREQSRPIFDALIKMIAPDQLISIGQDAKKLLQQVEIPVLSVRHPSYGGQREFEAGIRNIYGIEPVSRHAAKESYQPQFECV